MSDPEPTDEELERQFRPLLESERDELDRQSTATDADRAPVTLDQQSVGRLSRMDAMQVQAMAQAVDRRRQVRKAQIAAALTRMDAGEYGWCLACGEFIGMKRLQVDPATPRCVDCA